jgi:Tol biopolymer transport system component
LIGLALLISTSCKHQGETKLGAPEVPQAEVGSAERLTELGENFQATYSSDGQRILYVSRNRADHRNAQAYERNLSLKKENRITFQNGEVLHPRYVPGKDEILYASSTDELKESSPFLREKLKQTEPVSNLPPELQEPSEIYLHRLDGSGMVRLTTHPGFDGWPVPFPANGANKDRVAWTELEKNFLRVRTISQAAHNESSLTKLPANSAQYSPSPAPKSSDAAWITFTDDFKASHLWLQQGKNLKELAPDLVGIKTDLTWDASGTQLLFSFQPTPTTPYEIYSVNADGECLTKQSKGKADERYPSLSPDSTMLIFSSDARKGWQIYRRTWTRPCSAQTK